MYHIPQIRNALTTPCSFFPSSPSPSPSPLGSIFRNLQTDARVTTFELTNSLNLDPLVQMDAQEFVKLLITTTEFKEKKKNDKQIHSCPSTCNSSPLSFWRGSIQEYITPTPATKEFPPKLKDSLFYDLSLPIKPSLSSSLLSAYGPSSAELLSPQTANAYQPNKNVKLEALKGERLTRRGLPRVLTLHLKRFTFDWDSETTSKVNRKVGFGRVLDLEGVGVLDREEEGCQESFDSLYKLQSVVVHKGSFFGGHYYSYVNLGIGNKSKGGEEWWRFDDEIVERVEWEDVAIDGFGGSVSVEEVIEEEKRKSGGDGRLFDYDAGVEERCRLIKSRAGGGKTRRRNVLGRLLDRVLTSNREGEDAGSYGYGGQTACAYLLQYVKMDEIDSLYEG